VEEQNHENQNYGELHYIESDLKLMGVKMWRKKAEDKFWRRHCLKYRNCMPVKKKKWKLVTCGLIS